MPFGQHTLRQHGAAKRPSASAKKPVATPRVPVRRRSAPRCRPVARVLQPVAGGVDRLQRAFAIALREQPERRRHGDRREGAGEGGGQGGAGEGHGGAPCRWPNAEGRAGSGGRERTRMPAQFARVKHCNATRTADDNYGTSCLSSILTGLLMSIC